MTSYPERQATTNVGELRVQLHSADRGVILVGDVDSGGEVEPLIVNGIPHSGRIFIERSDNYLFHNWPAGWRPTPHGFVVKRTDRTFPEKTEPTDGAMDRFYRACSELLIIALGNAEFVREGTLAGLREERQGKLAEIARLQGQVDALNREADLLSVQIKDLES